MACRLWGARPLPEPMLTVCQLYLHEEILVKFELETKQNNIFIQENASENVACKMEAILQASTWYTASGLILGLRPANERRR